MQKRANISIGLIPLLILFVFCGAVFAETGRTAGL